MLGVIIIIFIGICICVAIVVIASGYLSTSTYKGCYASNDADAPSPFTWSGVWNTATQTYAQMVAATKLAHPNVKLIALTAPGNDGPTAGEVFVMYNDTATIPPVSSNWKKATDSSPLCTNIRGIDIKTGCKDSAGIPTCPSSAFSTFGYQTGRTWTIYEI